MVGEKNLTLINNNNNKKSMKKQLLMKTFLVAVSMLVGTSVAWAQTTAFSQDFTDKSSTDPATYGFNVTYGSGSSSALVNFSVAGGVLQCVAGPYASSGDGARTGTATAAFSSIGSGNEVTVSYVWALGSATGNASGSYTKTRIGNSSGNALELSFFGSESNGSLKVNGTTVKSGNSAIRNTTYTVSATLNMNEKKITSLTLTCSNSSFSYSIPDAMDFASDINSIDRFAFENSERQNWSNTSSIDNVTITYEEAREAVESFVVNYKLGDDIIATENVGTAGLYSGDSYTVPFRMYVEKDGALYKTTANGSNPYYGDVITLTKNTVVNKSLTAVDLNGGTLELLEDLDDTDGENAGIRASYRSCYNNKSYTSAVTLAPGVYTFIFRALNKGRGSSVKVGETTVCGIDDIVAKNNWGDKTITGVEIKTAGKVTLAKGGSNTIDCYDIIIAIRTGDATVSKTITAAGWATYCSPYALDFTGDIANLTDVYIVTGANANSLVLTSVKGGTVPANTGLLLEGTAGDVVIPIAGSSTTNVDANKLVGVTAETELAANGGYVLMGSPKVGFYQNTNAFTVGANTAYLPANFAATARSFYSFGDATGIGATLKNKETENKEVYNLKGQRVAQPTKGLYIKNGKKIVVK